MLSCQFHVAALQRIADCLRAKQGQLISAPGEPKTCKSTILTIYSCLHFLPRQFTLQSAELFFRRFLCGESFAHYFRPAEGTIEAVFAGIVQLFTTSRSIHIATSFSCFRHNFTISRAKASHRR